MRKSLATICSIATFALLLQGCAEDVAPLQSTTSSLKDGQVAFTLPDFNSESGDVATKTYHNGTKLVWSATDTVGIVPPAGSLIYFTGVGGGESITFDGGGWKLKPETEYTSFYPFVDDMYLDKTAVKYCVEGQSQQRSGARVHDGYDCLYSKATTSDGNSVSFVFTRLCIAFYFKVTPAAGTYTRLDICADDDIIPLEATFDLTAASPSLSATRKGKVLSLALDSLAVDGSTAISAYMTAIPCNWSGKALTIKLVTSEGREYAYSKTPSAAYSSPNTLYEIQLSDPTEVENAAFLNQTKYVLYDLSSGVPSAIFQYAEGDQISRYIRPELCEFRIGNPFSGKFMAFTIVPGSSGELYKTLEIYAPYKFAASTSDYTTYSGQTYENAQVLSHSGDRYYLKKDNLGFIVKYTEL